MLALLLFDNPVKFFLLGERVWFLFSVWDIMGTEKGSDANVCFTELIING
jgi:hypothetical protein